jgi:hypothetical protein
LITLITGAAMTAVTTSAVTQTKSKNLLNSKQAFYLAEAGLQHGKLLLNQNITNWDSYATAQPQTFINTTSLAGVGSYKVTLQDASGPALLMTSTGTGADNATISVSTLVTKGYPNNQKVFITGKGLTISGNATFNGTTGGVHANGNLAITANPSFTHNATATKSVTVTGAPTFAAGYTWSANQPQISINRVMVSTYYSARDYLLNSNGLVYNANKTKLTTSPITWNCWTPQPIWSYNKRTGQYYISSYWWKLTCGTTLNATYYVSGNVEIEADVGDATNPWITTIIATGSIKVTSNTLYIRRPLPTETSLYKSQTENMLFVANTDVLVVGTPYQNLTGIVRAREQIGISGDPTFTGYLVAQDAATSSTLVTSNYVSGNGTLTYNGDMANGIQGSVNFMTEIY